MGFFTPDVTNLRELYTAMLERALNSEKQILEDGLPVMMRSATNPDLAAAFAAHLEETRMHVSRLERILDEVEGEENEMKCKATAALISEGNSLASDATDPHVRDVVLIGAGTQVEHLEIAVYRTLKTLAEVMGEFDHADALGRTLEEEKKANEKLTQLAAGIHVEAAVVG